MKDVRQAFKTLKTGKAPGEDEVCRETLKAGGDDTARHLCQVLQNIWETAQPEDWKTGLMIKLPKKGGLSNCITLLSLSSKVFCRILLNRIYEAVDKNIRNEQVDSRKGRSCTDHMFVLRQVLEQSRKLSNNLYVVYVDFENAFDSLHRETLWKNP